MVENIHLLVRLLVLLAAITVALAQETSRRNDDTQQQTCSSEKQGWKRTQQTLDHFQVAGVNLAQYRQGNVPNSNNEEPPFELFADFDISSRIGGDEAYGIMIAYYKKKLTWPSLTFYNDKVAVKRWLPSLGIDIPRLFALQYASEIAPSGELEDQEKAILNLIPKKASDYVVKPSHKSRSNGVWVVSHNFTTGTTRLTSKVEDKPLLEESKFSPDQIAKSVARELHVPVPEYTSLTLRNVKPGIVVEERFTSWYDHEDDSALEFKVVIIWGRFFVAKWVLGSFRGPWWLGAVHRNGTMVRGSAVDSLPDWVDWSRVVDIAERLGAHKDFFRVDIFVGVPAGTKMHLEMTTLEERRAAARYVVSEISPTSSEPFGEEVIEEMVRLWIAGYKIGNYRVVPKTDVPVDFFKHDGSLPNDFL